MTKVFVSGSRSVRALPQAAKTSLDKIIELGFTVCVGDCHGELGPPGRALPVLCRYAGAGLSCDEELSAGRRHHIGTAPRNNHGFRTQRVSGSRQTDKDAAMAAAADYGLAVWDGRSPGTAKNIARVAKTKVVAL